MKYWTLFIGLLMIVAAQDQQHNTTEHMIPQPVETVYSVGQIISSQLKAGSNFQNLHNVQIK